jgi:hypothetical protein
LSLRLTTHGRDLVAEHGLTPALLPTALESLLND